MTTRTPTPLRLEPLEARDNPTAYVSPYAFTGLDPTTVADIAPRLQAAVYDTTPAVGSWYDTQYANSPWGPRLNLQPVAPLPNGVAPLTNASTTFYMQRLMAAAEQMIGTPYQHHHNPVWNPYANGFQGTDSSAAHYWPWLDVSGQTVLSHPTPVYQNGQWEFQSPTPTSPNPYRTAYHVPRAGIDCSDFAALVYNVAAGFYLNTAVGEQGVANAAGDYTGSSPIGWNTSLSSVSVNPAMPTDANVSAVSQRFFFGPNSTYDAGINARGLGLFNAPTPRPGDSVTMNDVIAQLQPGDLLYMGGNQGGSVTHVVMWLGKYATDPNNPTSTVPLVISSHDNAPGVRDANGNVPPPGVEVLPFTPDSWFYQNFSHAMRVLPTLTSVTVHSSDLTADAGQGITLTATIGSHSGTPTGQVRFLIDGQPVLVPLVNGVATYTTSSLALGSHSVTVTYLSDGVFAGDSAGLTQTVNHAWPIAVSVPTQTTNGTSVRWTGPDGQIAGELVPFPGFGGPVTTANGVIDGRVVVAAAAGKGGGPHVKVFDANTGAELQSFFAYHSDFRGGVSVALGDVTGDGAADIVTGAGEGGGPHVKVFDGKTGELVWEAMAYDVKFTGGVHVAVADVNGDGKADIITAAGKGGGPHVKVFDGSTFQEVRSFFAYDPGFTGGVNVAAGDLDGDGYAEIVTGAGAGGGPHVKVFDGKTGAEVRSFYAYNPAFAGGVNVAADDMNGDGQAEIITGAGPGGGPHVRVFDWNLDLLGEFMAGDPLDTHGVSVG